MTFIVLVLNKMVLVLPSVNLSHTLVWLYYYVAPVLPDFLKKGSKTRRKPIENQTEAGKELDVEREGNHWMYFRDRCGRCSRFAL